MLARETRYAITETGDWKLVGGALGDWRIHGHAYPAKVGEDAIQHDIRVQQGREGVTPTTSGVTRAFPM